MGEPKDDTTSARPEHRSNTHRARLTGRVDGPKWKIAELVRLFEDSNEARLGMRCQISLRVHAVVGFRDYLTIHCKERTEGVIPVAAGLISQDEGSAQQGILIHMEQPSAESTNAPRSRRPIHQANPIRDVVCRRCRQHSSPDSPPILPPDTRRSSSDS